MDKKAIITRIGDLLEQECGVCPKKTLTNGRQSSYERVCSGCSTFEELQELGRFLNTDDDGEKVRRILAKGENMTTNEILYLLENDVAKVKIYSALKMNRTDFYNMLKSFQKKKTGNEGEE